MEEGVGVREGPGGEEEGEGEGHKRGMVQAQSRRFSRRSSDDSLVGLFWGWIGTVRYGSKSVRERDCEAAVC